MKNFNTFTFFNQLTAMPKRLAMLLTVLFTLGVGSMSGAETYSWTCTGSTTFSTSGSSLNGVTWKASTSGISQGTGVAGEKCVQIAKNTGLTLETTFFKDKNITSISIQTWGSQENTFSLQDDNTKLATTTIPKSYTLNAAKITFSNVGMVKTKLVFKWESASKAFNVRSINITYEDAAPSCDKKVTLTKGSETNGTFTLDKANGFYDNCDEDFVVKVSNVVPKSSSQYCSGVNVTGGNSTVTGPVDGVWTVTYAKENNITSTITPTFANKTSAIITLFEAGATSSVSGKYVGDSYTLPSTSSQACGDKTFVGWSTEIIENSPTKPTAATYFEPGASVTLGATNKFYAVFAEGDGLSDKDEVLFSYEGGTSAALNNTEGLSADGLGSDYAENNAPYQVKLDNTGDYILYHNESKPYISQVIFKVKMIGGDTDSKITIKTSDDGKNYTQKSVCTISGNQNTIVTSTVDVNTSAKYIQFYFTKGSNVGFGPLYIYTKSTSYQNYTTQCTAPLGYTVTFNANGHGTAPTAQTVESGQKATEPTPAPTTTGYTFGGWYKESGCTNKFDFNTSITDDITLYAKWIIIQYTVTLNPNYPTGKTGTFKDNEGNSVEQIELKYDYNTSAMDVVNLYESIELDGYQFNGWYNATAGGSRWTSTGTITKDINLYAQWTKLHTIILCENGTTTNPTIQASTSYTLPTELSAGSCQDDTKEFVGWSTVAIPTPGDKPTSKYHELGETVTLSTDETTFYAVFATVGGATVTKTITLSPPTTTSSYKTGTKTDSEGNIWSYYAAINNLSGTYEFGLNADDKNYHIASPEFAGVVTSVSFKARNGSSSESRKFLFCSSNSTAKPSTGDLAEVIIPKSEQYNNTYTADLSASSVSQFYIYTPKALGITNISVTYTTSGGVSYSDYVTSCSSTPTPDPVNSDWVLTPLADITCNDLVVITMKNSNGTYALTNGNGTSDAPIATKVDVANGKLSKGPDDMLQWVIMNNNGGLTIYPVDDYNSWLYCDNENDGVRVADKENKVFIVDKNSGYLYNQSTARYLGVYNNSEWRCYTTVNDNIKEQTLAFYVKKDANPNPCEKPVDDGINPVATFIFNTAEGLEKLGITNVVSYLNISEGREFIQEGVTMTNVTNSSSTSTRVWLTTSGNYDLRMYKKAVFKLSVPQGHNIRKVVFEGDNINYLTADNGEFNQKVWTGKQQEVVFTIADDAATVKIYTISVAVDYTRDVTPREYGTICIPYGSNNYTGAEFYEISWMEMNGATPKGIWLDQVNGALTAGKPYIFKATSTVLTVNCTGTAVATPVEGVAGLTGTFEDIPNTNDILEGNYMISGNQFLLCPAGCWLNANRAYIDATEIAKHTTKKAEIPGRRRVCLGENVSTSFENVTNGENTTIKVIENGQLIIIRNGVKYNVQGQRL